MEVVLLCLIVFALTVDQFAFTGILSRPLVACTLIGAVLGNTADGAIIGANLEIMLITYEQSYRFTERGLSFVLYGAVACIFAMRCDMDTSTAVSTAFAFAALGTYLTYMLFGVNTVFVPLARTAAEKHDGKKLTAAVILPMILAGAVNCAAAAIAYKAGSDAGTLLGTIGTKAGWILNGFSAAGVLLPCIGFAVLLRNIGTKDLIGALAGGVAAGALVSTYFYKGFGMTLIVLAAAAIAVYDYHAGSKSADNGNAMKGGAQKWW